MTKPEFKKAVDTEKIPGLSQPKSFMEDKKDNKQWNDYSEAIKKEQENKKKIRNTKTMIYTKENQ